MKNLVTKYHKIEIFDNLYLYKFVGIIEDVKYNSSEECVYYTKKGTKKCLYEIENLYFTVSGEKRCFDEYLEKEQLIEIYGTDNDAEIRKLVIGNCNSMIKFGIFDEEKESLKIINSDVEKIKSAKPDLFFSDYYLSSNTEHGTLLSMSTETVDSLLEQLEKNNVDDVVHFLNDVKYAAEKLIIESFEVELTQEKEQEVLKVSNDEQISNLLKQLNSLVGLKNVKEIVEQFIIYLDYINRTKETQNLENPNLNMVFKGNPGTGKTTVARILAKLLYYLGYVEEDKFVEITAQSLIAGYIGQTAIKTRKLLDENKGGVIFLDEAYVMCAQHASFAQEALVEILKEMETKKTVFIFAGYQQEMTDFIKMNPGFESRLGSTIEFDDYTLDELFQILIQKLNMHGLVLHEDAIEEVKEIIRCQKDRENFGNGRYIHHLFDKIIMNHAKNCKEVNDIEILRTISVDDLHGLEEKVKEKTIGFRV